MCGYHIGEFSEQKDVRNLENKNYYETVRKHEIRIVLRLSLLIRMWIFRDGSAIYTRVVVQMVCDTTIYLEYESLI